MDAGAGSVPTRAHLIVAGVAVVATGMAYTLLWGPVVLHVPVWVVPGDIWGTFRDAHIVGWGGEGILYASDVQRLTGYISLPGMPALLAPVAMLSGALNLSESLPLTLSHPSAWLLLGPVEMALGASVLFPLDAVAARLGLRGRRRALLVWSEAALIWPVVTFWGHPEDLIALGLGLYALRDARDGAWRRSALLLGAAIAFQPLVIVLAPLVLTSIPWRRWGAAIGLSAGPSLALLAAPLAHAWSTTVSLFANQPTYPSSNHPTPWVALSTVLQRASRVHGAVVSSAAAGHYSMHPAVGTLGETVAGGPVRLVPIALSVLAAVYARCRRTERALWALAAACLALRCLFEAVMTPYYAVPALAVGIALAAALSSRRFLLAAAGAAWCTWLGYRNAGTWGYYLPVVTTLVWTLASGWRLSTAPATPLHAGNRDDEEPAPEPVAPVRVGA